MMNPGVQEDSRYLVDAWLPPSLILAVDIGVHGAAALLDQSGALLDVVDLPTLESGPAYRPEI